MALRLSPLDAEDLQRLDHARDEDSASSHNALKGELSRLCYGVRLGLTLRIDTESGVIYIRDVADFQNWCYARYPNVAPLELPAS
jgi:hypothetical protein